MTYPPASDLVLRRDRAAVLASILATRTAYAPDWLLTPGAPGHGLAEIFAGQLELLQQRLAQIPDHRQAVLLDLLGVSLLPAQGARTHVLLTAVPGTRGARVPAGTRVGAAVPGRDAPVVFESLDPIAISPAGLVEVHSVLPASDAEQDHSADALARRSTTLFGAPTRVDRDLYVGHDELLAFDGRAVVELEVGIGVPAAVPMPLDWSWWDGEQWRAFAPMADSASLAGDGDSVDGTGGLTRSGTVRLIAPMATAKPQQIDGRTTYWLRGRLKRPLEISPAAQPPTLTRLRLVAVNQHRRLEVRRTGGLQTGQASLRIWWPERAGRSIARHLVDLSAGARSTVDLESGDEEQLTAAEGHLIRIGVSDLPARPAHPPGPAPADDDPIRAFLDLDDDLSSPVLADADTRVDVTVHRGLPLDKAIADQRAADLSKAFAPLGPSPARGTTFLFASASATRRPGTRVTLVVERPVTAAEEADRLSGVQESAVKIAKTMLDSAIGDLEGSQVTGALNSASTTLGNALPTLMSTDPGTWYAGVRSQIQQSLAELRQAATSDHTVWSRVVSARNRIQDVIDDADPTKAVQARNTLDSTSPEVARVLVAIAEAVELLAAGAAVLAAPRAALQTAIAAGDPTATANAESALSSGLATFLATAAPWLPSGALPPIFSTDPATYVATVSARLTTAKNHVDTARTKVGSAVTTLKDINPGNLVAAVVPSASTQLSAPRVAWEYHDGDRWRALGVSGDDAVISLQASGSVSFTVPADIAEVDIDGDVRRWLRARLADGSYSHLRLVSWTDKSGVLNFLPVVEPRAPLIDSVEVYYTHHSEPRDPMAVVVHDDHAWRDIGAALTWPGNGVAPFLPMAEAAPTLYLGFDGDLPADRIGVWFQLAGRTPWDPPYRPVWEGYDGRTWVRLATDDGTDGLRRTGVVGLVWPGTSGAPGSTVGGAKGRSISLIGNDAALRFSSGDRLMLSDVQGQEPVVVAAVAGTTVTTRDDLSRPYSSAQLTVAPPARFGAPRTWLRAVFDPTQPAPQLTVTRVAPHAVAVAQVETLYDELLGSGDGSTAQVLAARRFPIAGDVALEVRELDGDRADLDADVLTRTLTADGVDPAGVRLHRDPRTGKVSEVWVPWRPTTTLGSAGPFDRVFTLDRARGRFLFGGQGHGRPLPEGRDNVRLRSYRTCDGAVGNVPAGSIDKVLSAVAVADVDNPEPATGGAEVEPLERALVRGPALLRHRRLALTEQDVEAIAREASPAVVRARAIGAVDRYGRPQPGAVRVVIVPRDGTDRPQPGASLLATVRDAVVAASPVAAMRRVVVEGPHYREVGVALTVLPVDPSAAGPTRERVRAALAELMHPLRGGTGGDGWDFGAAVYLSDLARVLESVPGVDVITDLVLTRDAIPVGDTAPVGPDEVICAGPLTVRLGQGV
ncbi:hypothetical protein ACWF0M_01340 [Kribbella sp. NPDC055110]